MHFIKQHLKNIPGWRTNRRLIVFSIDDYGNVRLDSRKARKNLDNKGFPAKNRFDAFDTLETNEDLEALYDALCSVKDKNGRHAVFTPYAMSCNLDFDKMRETGYKEFFKETVVSTFEKNSSLNPSDYNGAWALWKEGIDKGIMQPQFHGREHLNLKLFNEKLAEKSKDIITALENRSYTSIQDSKYPTISYTAAFEFWEYQENDKFKDIIADGIKNFEQVYGYKPTNFNPPGGREHPVIHWYLHESKIKYLDAIFMNKQHQGKGKYKRKLNYTGMKNKYGQITIMRNVSFEPNNGKFDHVGKALSQIETAFRYKKPAVISSHRVNFCGKISAENRKMGLQNLRSLLNNIVQKWPDVEFVSASELGNIIQKQ